MLQVNSKKKQEKNRKISDLKNSQRYQNYNLIGNAQFEIP